MKNEYNIGINIRDRRKTLGKKQKDISDQIGVSKSQISKWENETSFPSVSNFIKLSNALNIRPDALIEGRVQEDLVENKEQKQKREKTLIIILCILVGILCIRFAGDVYLKFFYVHDGKNYKREILYKKPLEDGTWEIRQIVKSDNDVVWGDVVLLQKGENIIDGSVLEVICANGNEELNYETELEKKKNRFVIHVYYNEENTVKIAHIIVPCCKVD